jgi:hypothetical protein
MRSRLAGICAYGLGVTTMLVAIQQHLFAGTNVAAPEIDASSISTAVGVIAAGVLILRSRGHSK